MASDQSGPTFAKTLEDKDVFKAILDTRNFEISLFWQRSNYFLALNSALAVGFFTREPSRVTLLLAALGALSSLLWYLVMLGAKYWQSRWEDKLSEVESAMAPDLKAFAANRQDTDVAVKRSLENNKHGWWVSQILKKPSVSYQMTVLSLVFVVGWCLVAALAVSQGAWSNSSYSSAASTSGNSTSSSTSAACTASAPASAPTPTSSFTANPTINIQLPAPEIKPPPRPQPPPPKKEGECK